MSPATINWEMIVYFLAWCSAVLGTGLVGCLVWFALRIVNQLDALEKLVRDEFHELDIRVAKLEAWKDGFLNKHGSKD